MPLINCEINLILTWPTECVISSATAETTFAIRGRLLKGILKGRKEKKLKERTLCFSRKFLNSRKCNTIATA